MNRGNIVQYKPEGVANIYAPVIQMGRAIRNLPNAFNTSNMSNISSTSNSGAPAGSSSLTPQQQQMQNENMRQSNFNRLFSNIFGNITNPTPPPSETTVSYPPSDDINDIDMDNVTNESLSLLANCISRGGDCVRRDQCESQDHMGECFTDNYVCCEMINYNRRRLGRPVQQPNTSNYETDTYNMNDASYQEYVNRQLSQMGREQTEGSQYNRYSYNDVRNLDVSGRGGGASGGSIGGGGYGGAGRSGSNSASDFSSVFSLDDSSFAVPENPFTQGEQPADMYCNTFCGSQQVYSPSGEPTGQTEWRPCTAGCRRYNCPNCRGGDPPEVGAGSQDGQFVRVSRPNDNIISSGSNKTITDSRGNSVNADAYCYSKNDRECDADSNCVVCISTTEDNIKRCSTIDNTNKGVCDVKYAKACVPIRGRYEPFEVDTYGPYRTGQMSSIYENTNNYRRTPANDIGLKNHLEYPLQCKAPIKKVVSPEERRARFRFQNQMYGM